MKEKVDFFDLGKAAFLSVRLNALPEIKISPEGRAVFLFEPHPDFGAALRDFFGDVPFPVKSFYDSYRMLSQRMRTAKGRGERNG